MEEEVWVNILNQKGSVHLSHWPVYNPKTVAFENINLPVQVNGKLRGQLVLTSKEAQDKTAVVNFALKDTKLQKWLTGKDYQVIFVPAKIINFIIK